MVQINRKNSPGDFFFFFSSRRRHTRYWRDWSSDVCFFRSRTDVVMDLNRVAAPTDGVVDLRSDTVTRPTAEMRAAMASAEVGDDVYGEDPTVNRLEARAAEIFGKEAALLVPTGCMGNLTAIKGWTHHGDEVICEERSHVNLYELASMSAIAGCMPRVARAEDGILTWKQIEAGIRPEMY